MRRFLSRSFSFALVFGIHFFLSQTAAGHDDREGRGGFTIRTLSTWPDRVSGGDAWLRSPIPATSPASH